MILVHILDGIDEILDRVDDGEHERDDSEWSSPFQQILFSGQRNDRSDHEREDDVEECHSSDNPQELIEGVSGNLFKIEIEGSVEEDSRDCSD